MTYIRMFRAVLVAMALWGASPFGVAMADSDQQRARAALERGEIRPLDQVLAAVRAAVPGDVIAVSLKGKRDRWHYKLKILTQAGKRVEVKIDAKTLEIFDRDEDDDDD